MFILQFVFVPCRLIVRRSGTKVLVIIIMSENMRRSSNATPLFFKIVLFLEYGFEVNRSTRAVQHLFLRPVRTFCVIHTYEEGTSVCSSYDWSIINQRTEQSRPVLFKNNL
jgi:hypothetical protein